MSEKHTHGPWSVGPISGAGALLIRPGWQSSVQIAPIEDARLMAAAPELLAALKLVDGIRLYLGDGVRAQVDAAIAKAEGRTT